MKDKVETIKVGELLYIMTDGVITGVDSNSKTASITFKYNLPDNTGRVSNTVRIPIEYGVLAEYFFPFMIPGPFATGDDYYPTIGNEKSTVENENISYIVRYNDKSYKLIRDKYFSRTGKYYLTPMEAGSPIIVRHAQLLGIEHLEKIKQNIINTVLKKGTLQGRFVWFYDTSEVVNGTPLFINYEGCMGTPTHNMLVRLQDSQSYLEIDLPLALFFSSD